MNRKLSDAQLSGVFVEYTDADLIAELRRRGRLCVVGQTSVWYNDLSGDERYMEAMQSDIVAKLARALDNSLCVKNRDRVIARDHCRRPQRTVRYASLMVVEPTDSG